MSNMSYCRFQNTYPDVLDCLGALDEGTTLSQDEHSAAEDMFNELLRWFYDNSVIEDYDEDAMRDILDAALED